MTTTILPHQLGSCWESHAFRPDPRFSFGIFQSCQFDLRISIGGLGCYELLHPLIKIISIQLQPNSNICKCKKQRMDLIYEDLHKSE